MKQLKCTEDFYALKVEYESLLNEYKQALPFIPSDISTQIVEAFETFYLHTGRGIRNFIINNNVRGYHSFNQEQERFVLCALENMASDVQAIKNLIVREPAAA